VPGRGLSHNDKVTGKALLLFCGAVLLMGPAAGHRLEGELSLLVRDPSGAPLAARVKLTGRLSGYAAESDADNAGRWRARHLPFGPYRLQASRPGFAPYDEAIEIRSEIPQIREIALALEPVETVVQVLDSSLLVDPRQSGTVFQVERERLAEKPFSAPGRGAAGLVNSLPGWLMEANSVLHPRGSEYDTQYVIDGLPLTDNRSLAFAPALETDELEAVHVLTASFPAEYGRKLGGVVELFTRRNDSPGHHPEIALRGGSFSSAEAYVSDSFVSGRTALWVGLRAGLSDRFLDPPALENFTNHAGLTGASFRVERDLSPRDRLQVYWRSNRLHFLVPNDLLQQQHGQRQDRRNRETAGVASFHHVFASSIVAVVRGSVRDLSVRLWSNPLATPVFAEQDRGFREAYLSGQVTVQKRAHLVKFGVDSQTAGVREKFFYRAGAGKFLFEDRRRGRDLGAFLQDRWQLGRWTLDAGLRWDHYRLLVRDSAWSPRLAVAYHWERPDLVWHASYDRVFQTPAIENLLLTGALEGLAVRPSRGHFLEVGARKGFGRLLRIEANQFWRRFRQFADDEVFLNTGIGFPIAFDRARIHGTEARVEIPGWRGVSGYASWSNLSGTGYLPLTGGLFLGDAAERLRARGGFPISQDQRNTARAQVRFQLHRRWWAAWGVQYSSGLPFELDLDDKDDLAEIEKRFSPRLLRRVNFSRGRVRPAFSWDVSAGADLWKREKRSVRLQIDLLNAGNRLNLINFSGLLSGVAIAPPRTMGGQLRLQL